MSKVNNSNIENISEAITCTPFPHSQKIYVPGSLYPHIRVPMRQVSLTNGEHVNLYDTSGPYTDPHVSIDVHQGLAPLRETWILSRQDTESYDARIPSALHHQKPRRACQAKMPLKCIMQDVALLLPKWNILQSEKTKKEMN